MSDSGSHNDDPVREAMEEHAQKLTEAELTLDLMHSLEQLYRFATHIRGSRKEDAIEWVKTLCERGHEHLNEMSEA